MVNKVVTGKCRNFAKIPEHYTIITAGNAAFVSSKAKAKK